jgi:predicted metal-dependent phosphotriesterase family hydrolase
VSHVMTVLGPCDPLELGVTASHEHLFAEATSDRSDPDTRLDDLDTIIAELLAYKEAGGDAVIEVTTIDMGRDVNRLAQASAASGVKVIAATGYYKGNYSPEGSEVRQTWAFLPREYRAENVEALVELFVREVREGVANTDVQVGIIGEIGTSYKRILEDEEKVFRAAARANRETGVPVSTHTTLGTMGLEQVEILKQEGANLNQVVVCHLDLMPDTAYHVQLARQGVFLGFDTAGKTKYQSDAQRVECIKRVVQEGFEDQVLISCDVGRRSDMVSCGGRGYAYLLTRFVPLLQRAGIDDTVIHKFLVENPRRLLAF